jgi:hypothetical protein
VLPIYARTGVAGKNVRPVGQVVRADPP